MLDPLPLGASSVKRSAQYDAVSASIRSLIDGVDDWISAMATVACELHSAFEFYHWTGFYRVVGPALLRVGPYQGGHGCLEIPFDRGVCGAAARRRATQLVEDVDAFEGHIACSSSTRSEIVVPVLTSEGRLLAVLDVDSDDPAAFTALDRNKLEAICAELAERYRYTQVT